MRTEFSIFDYRFAIESSIEKPVLSETKDRKSKIWIVNDSLPL